MWEGELNSLNLFYTTMLYIPAIGMVLYGRYTFYETMNVSIIQLLCVFLFSVLNRNLIKIKNSQ